MNFSEITDLYVISPDNLKIGKNGFDLPNIDTLLELVEKNKYPRKIIPPIITYEEGVRLSDNAIAIARSLLSEFSIIWNERHRTNYSESFWRYIAYPWLMDISHAVTKRTFELKGLLESFHTNALNLHLYASPRKWAFADLNDFRLRGIVNPIFERWLNSFILRQYAGKDWKIIDYDIPEIGLKIAEPDKEILGSIPYSKQQFGRLNGPILELWVRICESFSPYKRDISHNFELYKPNSGDIVVLKDMVRKLAILTEPSTLNISFSAFCDNAKKYKYQPNKIRLALSNLYYNEECKFLCAYTVENGGRVVAAQHGAQYGLEKLIPMAREIEYSQHAMLTWGWQKHTNHPGRFYPVSAPKLSGVGTRQKNPYLFLLVGLQMRVNDPRIASSPTSTDWLKYRNSKIKLIEALKPGIRKSLLYRPGTTEKQQLSDLAYLEQNLGLVNIFEENLRENLPRTKLLVCDYPGTIFLESLASNTPVVATWSLDVFPWCDSAQSELIKLQEVKIFIENPVEAANHINQNWENLNNWWNSEKTQKTRRDFCLKYARHSRFWLLQWMAVIWKLSR